jgi:hypothetical protein
LAIIYFDEAGNTGADLMNKEQTLYVLCSSRISEQESNKIINNYFGQKDLHFKTLKNGKNNQQQIIKLLTDNEETFKENMRYCYYHKKFLILCQMLNYFYEPQLYDDGIDYYNGGMNIAHANYFYMCAYAFCGEIMMDNILRSFMNMVRIQTKEAINNYYISLQRAYTNCKHEEFKGEFYILSRTFEDIGKYLSGIEKYILDPSSHALIGLVEQWLNELAESIDIVHDRSASVDITKKYLEILINIDTDPIRIGYGKFKTLLPLKVNSFIFESSKNSKSIQLCDLVASTVFFINNERQDIDKQDFKNDIINLVKDWKTYGSFSPSTNVSLDPDRKKQDGDIDPIDYIAYQKWKSEHGRSV